MKRWKIGKMLLILLMIMIGLSVSPSMDSQAATVKLNKSSAVLKKKGTVTLKVTGTTKKVTWKSSNKKIATVSQKGKVKAKKAGTAKITATVGKKRYVCKITVVNKTYKLMEGNTVTLNPASLKGAGTKSYSSSDKKVAKVSKKGKVTAKGAGTAVITIKAGKKYYYAKIKVSAQNSTTHTHNYTSEVTTAATCTKAGTVTHTCSVCGDTYEEKISALGHDYEAVTVVEPTCDSRGYTEYVCKNDSSHTKQDNFTVALGHDYEVLEVLAEATCEQEGSKKVCCSVCNEEAVVAEPATGHDYVNGVCSICGNSEVESTVDKMEVSVSETTVTIHVDGIGNGGDTARIIRMDPYEYADGDSLSGLSETTAADGEDIAVYQCGTEVTYTMLRYQDDIDYMYSKFYVVSDSGLLKGPIYPSEITPERDVDEFVAESKKGLFGENDEYVKDTECSYTTFNLDITNMIYANEDENGETLDNSGVSAYTYIFQGKKYYFNKNYIDSIDAQVKDYTDNNIGVSLIIGGIKSSGYYNTTYPYALTYGTEATSYGSLIGFNTSNELGMEYWAAAMEFLAERYSREDGEYGRIVSLTLGNEVDYPNSYNKISGEDEPLDVYMEEYSRMMRITWMAVSKYMDTVTVTIPTTHYWAKSGHDVYSSVAYSYSPKEMLDWLNAKTKAEGDYDWGYSPHCYPNSLAGSNGAADDTHSLGGRSIGMTNDYNTTTVISFNNLEVLDEYLNQPELQYNGQARKLYLTESGCSSYAQPTTNEDGETVYYCAEEDLRKQAAYVAAAYYKCANLDSVVAFIYYRAIDHEAEMADYLACGLVNADGSYKYSYELWKYIDTQYSFYIADQYLSSAMYYDEDMNEYTVDNGAITSYKDLMDVFSTGFDSWDEDKIICRTVDTIDEWEDKVDLGNVQYLDASYLYDGEEHELFITGDLPDGVTVQYENNTMTEKGEQEAVARFYMDDELVATRRATMHVGNVMANKSVYEYDEKIYITGEAEGDWQWVGLYKADEDVDPDNGGAVSIYWYYLDQTYNGVTRYSGNTYVLQEGESNSRDLGAGEYKIVVLGKDATYDVNDSFTIEILEEGESSGLVRLDGVSFTDTIVTYDGTEQTLEITGELPEGVTVEYTNNVLIDEGNVKATASFYKNDVLLETRNATLTVTGTAE